MHNTTSAPSHSRVGHALLLCLVLIAAPSATLAQESSVLPAEIMPLASQSLLLDVTRVDGDGFVAVGERGHILRSANGRDWQQAASVPTRSTLTSVASVGGELWAAGHDQVILHSTDGGENWTRQHVSEDVNDPGLNSPILGIFFTDPSNGFALGAYGYFLRTRDGGESWEESLTMAREDDDGLDEDDASYDEMGDEDFADEDVGDDDMGDDGDFEEDDGQGDFSYDYSDYEDDFTDFHLNDMARLDDDALFIAAEAGNGLLSADAGETWSNVQFPYEGSMFGVLATRDGTLIAYGLRGNVMESVDGGENWDQMETGTLNSLMGGIELADGRVVMVGANGEILIREESGYRSSLHPDGVDLAAVAQADDGSLVLVGENGVATYALGQ